MDSKFEIKDFKVFYSSIFFIADKDYLYRDSFVIHFNLYESLHNFVFQLQHVLKQIFQYNI